MRLFCLQTNAPVGLSLRRALCTCLVVLALGLSCAARGDEVFLADGSKLVGRLVQMSEAGLVIETDFAADPITIDSTKVAGLATDGKVMVALKTGERAAGKLTRTADGQQTLAGTTFGDVSLPVDRIQSIWSTDAPDATVAGSAELAAVKQQHEQQVAELEEQHQQQITALQETVDKSQGLWTARAEFGLDGQTGNTERLGFHGRLEARRTAEADRLLAYVQGRFAQQDGTRNTNEILGGLNLERDLTDRFFVYGRVGMEYDEFENLDMRGTVTVGGGYFFIREEGHELKTRAGIGYQHESFSNGISADQALLELGVDYLREIAPWLTLTHHTTYYPTFDDLADFRLSSETAGEIPVGDAEDWKVKAGVRTEYDAVPQPGVDRLDTYYFINLVYDLEK